jgi:hypothetical protein
MTDQSLSALLPPDWSEAKLWAALLVYPTLVGLLIPILYQVRHFFDITICSHGQADAALIASYNGHVLAVYEHNVS